LSNIDTLSPGEAEFLRAIDAYSKAIQTPAGPSDEQANRLIVAAENVDQGFFMAFEESLAIGLMSTVRVD
jgi:hypothetical protein